MIHPGGGGCEVYTSLANKLTNDYSCYGIDSYNLYNENKIENLHELAKYYLSYIDELMQNTQQKVYHLLGWSLGGQISLEIAYVLEQRGSTKITVYLLDTILNDDYLLSLINSTDVIKFKNEFRNYATTEGYEKIYMEKVISNMDVENKLNRQKISSILTHTNVLLFKAMLEDTRFKLDEFNKKSSKYFLTLAYNNIDRILKNRYNIKLIKINNAHHGNILDQEELLVRGVLRLESVSTCNQDQC